MAYLLIVEDDEDFASAVATVLQADGFEVDIKLDPESAMQAIKRRRPDLVILDIMFPEDSSAGFTLARKIRDYIEKAGNIPVLVLTAVNQRFPLGFSDRDIDEEWLPVSEFLEKPVDMDVLLNRVKALLDTNHGSAKR